MFTRLLTAIRETGKRNQEVAREIGLHPSAFSRRLNRIENFTPAQQMALARITGVSEPELFAEGPAQAKMGTPVAELFKLLDECLANWGDPIFLLEKIQRMEAAASYEAACAYVTSTLRRQNNIPPRSGPLHWIVTWTEGCQRRFQIESGPPRREQDSIQRAGESLIHPVRNGNYPPIRETTMANPKAELRS